MDGQSIFSEDMLARLIAKAETDLQAARKEYASALAQAEDEWEVAHKIRVCYNQFCEWADEFEMASTARKREIPSQLYDRVTIGRGYEMTVEVNRAAVSF